MAEKVLKPEAKEVVKKSTKQDNTTVSGKKRVGLVEMMIILMLVGLVFIFIFPLQQLKEDKAAEELAKEKISPLLRQFEMVTIAMEEYRNNDPFGEYPFAIEELNLTNLNTPEFIFSYDAEALKITATTTDEYGKANVKVNYDMKAKLYSVEDPTPERKPTIKEEWLIF